MGTLGVMLRAHIENAKISCSTVVSDTMRDTGGVVISGDIL
jgi:hypothetical protein